MSELLLILTLSAAAQDVPPAMPVAVLQSASPRVLIVRAEPGVADRLRAEPAVVLVTADQVPAAVMASLTAAERLFVEAWQLRRNQGDQGRRGEGLPWDAPGFEPPDPPN